MQWSQPHACKVASRLLAYINVNYSLGCFKVSLDRLLAAMVLESESVLK